MSVVAERRVNDAGEKASSHVLSPGRAAGWSLLAIVAGWFGVQCLGFSIWCSGFSVLRVTQRVEG